MGNEHKEVNLKNINIQIATCVFAGVLLLSIYFIVSTYKFSIDSAEKNALKRMRTITATTALQIDGLQHEMMFNKYTSKDGINNVKQDSMYFKIHCILKKVHQTNNLQSTLYTAVFDTKNNNYLMGVTSDDSTFFRHPYSSFPQESIKNYNEGGVIPTYKDEYGYWLSAFSPIKNSKGKTVACLHTDIQFDDFIKTARKGLFNNILISVGVLAIIAFFLGISLRAILKRDKAAKEKLIESKKIIQEKQKELLDSINYAKRIQNAILPTPQLVRDNLQDHFILYLPKDVIAGDFYWLETFALKGAGALVPEKPLSSPLGEVSGDSLTEGVLLAVADCTGHGVPGAMVSVVCNNALNRSVREHGLTDPGKILDKTCELVANEFGKSEDDVKDGMDIALCSLSLDANKAERSIKYAGANNPLWLIHKGELVEIKGDKQPIGKHAETVPFTTHSFELQKGDVLYIFTDGFADQFGGPKGKKYKYKPFKDFLLSNNGRPMEQQRNLLIKEFNKWKGEHEQVDDVCIIGVRV